MFSNLLLAALLSGLPAIMGIALALSLCFFRQARPTPLPWPIFVFLLVLGIGAANIGGVSFGGSDALISSSSGGFLGDELDVMIQGVILLFFALPGLLVSLFTLRIKSDHPPCSGSAWIWSWLLTQSVLDIIVLVMGISVSFRTFFTSNDGLPLWTYLAVMGLLTVGLGFLFGYRWGRIHSVLVPLLGWLGLSVITLILLTLMRFQPSPTWGLSLIQCPAGSWYSLLFTPSAVLLGDYQYAWDITKLGLLASGLAPHALFTLGYLAPKLCKRGSFNDRTDHQN